MSIVRIEHHTHFRYQQEAGSSYNEARLTPAWLPRQRVLESSIEVSPQTWSTTFRDYWECEVTAFEVLQPHRTLDVIGTSLVEILPNPPRAERVGWEALRQDKIRDLLCEYLDTSPVTEAPPELAEFAADAATRLSPESTARAVCEFINDQMGYVPGATTVHTPAIEAWEAKSGVCQDFAQLAAGTLRGVGIPARYVSGYLHPKRDAVVGETVAGESHAWVEWWTGDWTGFDPTNDREVGDHHVIVGRAREYADIPPLTGVVAGTTEQLDVTVSITKVA